MVRVNEMNKLSSPETFDSKSESTWKLCLSKLLLVLFHNTPLKSNLINNQIWFHCLDLQHRWPFPLLIFKSSHSIHLNRISEKHRPQSSSRPCRECGVVRPLTFLCHLHDLISRLILREFSWNPLQRKLNRKLYNPMNFSESHTSLLQLSYERQS